MKIILFACLVFFLAPVGFASLISFNNYATFQSQGTIAERYGFDDMGTGFTYPGNPWTIHGVTYKSGSNIIVGTGTSYNPISNVICYSSWSPMIADINTSPAYTMFGFDLSYIGASSPITLEIYTNLATYTYTGISAPLASVSYDFYGYIASAGEYFIGFKLSSAQGSGSAPTIDNVTLGIKGSVVPEPTTWLLLMLGLIFSKKLFHQKSA